MLLPAALFLQADADFIGRVRAGVDRGADHFLALGIDHQDLARGILNIQRFYRRLCRNGYNLGILAVELPSSRLELRAVMMVRSNYAPWVRSDHTGFEVMLGDMTTFNAPEHTAEQARAFF